MINYLISKLRLLFFAAVLLISGSVSIQASTLVDLGNNTLDTNTNLKWLDLTFTKNQSYDTVLARLSNPTDIAYGYRFASLDEISNLLVDADVFSSSDWQKLYQLISLLGPTIITSTPPLLTVQIYGLSSYAGALSGYPVSWMQSCNYGPTACSVEIWNPRTIATSYDAFDFLGSFLVIDTNPIPLPAALPLFATGLGMMGLLGWRRKRKKTAAMAKA